jgi:hypothetical protein
MVELLPSKYETLSSNPSTAKKKNNKNKKKRKKKPKSTEKKENAHTENSFKICIAFKHMRR